jgi:hypothetical protein
MLSGPQSLPKALFLYILEWLVEMQMQLFGVVVWSGGGGGAIITLLLFSHSLTLLVPDKRCLAVSFSIFLRKKLL